MKKKKPKKKKHWFGRIPVPKPSKVITPETVYDRKKIKRDEEPRKAYA